MSKFKVTLAASLVVMIVAVALVLATSPPRVARASGPLAGQSLGVTQNELTLCQAGETLQAGVSAIRVSIVAFIGSNMQVVVLHHGKVVTRGSRNPAWSGSTATISIKPVAHTISNVEVCFAWVPNSELLQIFGTPVTRANQNGAAIIFKNNPRNPGVPVGEGQLLRGRVHIEYLAPGSGSWWTRIGSVATHMGYGHFISGNAVALLALASMAAVGVLTVRLALREQP
jgi:hypothetical protein